MHSRARPTRDPTSSRARPVSMAFSSFEHNLSESNNRGDPDLNRRSTIIVEGDPDLNRRSTIIVEGTQTASTEIDPEFAYPDGNIELQASTHIFQVHEFQLAKFVKLAELIRQARDRGEVTSGPERRVKVSIQCTGRLRSKDIRHTLQVIYSSFVSGRVPPTFDAVALISTLRVATLYQNPDLREFAISQLQSKFVISPTYRIALSDELFIPDWEAPDLREFAISQLQSKFVISPTYRIALSDELFIPDWEAPAFTELCRRPEPISEKEASILGIARTVQVARLREAEQRHQYTSLIDQAIKDPFLSSDGTLKKDKLQAAAEQTLKHSSLPACDCRAQVDGRNEENSTYTWPWGAESNYNRRNSSAYGSSTQRNAPESLSVIPCRVHQLAPPIASESRALYKHLSGALGRLATLKRTVSTNMRGLPGSDKEYSVEKEIKQANWVRKVERL
ncbi:unnamed protein product [Rhizoctonia solani]|uniref:BTB domain-containing protein n=1 Tax=Rhizoctonia solani TaxID=456999 RepID=A0A8H3D0C4_9AGAM|nr:unnamed protein product [Rhizoctonia solani]